MLVTFEGEVDCDRENLIARRRCEGESQLDCLNGLVTVRFFLSNVCSTPLFVQIR